MEGYGFDFPLMHGTNDNENCTPTPGLNNTTSINPSNAHALSDTIHSSLVIYYVCWYEIIITYVSQSCLFLITIYITIL